MGESGLGFSGGQEGNEGGAAEGERHRHERERTRERTFRMGMRRSRSAPTAAKGNRKNKMPAISSREDAGSIESQTATGETSSIAA
jgi:hypothetical protein